MAKFAKGDRVRCIQADAPVLEGDLGTVLENSECPYVQWDVKRPGMHSELGGKDDVWCMADYEIELFNSTAPAQRDPVLLQLACGAPDMPENWWRNAREDEAAQHAKWAVAWALAVRKELEGVK